MKTNALSVYIGETQKKVIVGEDGLIDTDDPVNAFFLSKRIAKGRAKKISELNASPQYIPSKGAEEKKEPVNELPTYEESEQKLKYLDTLKREKEVEKLEIDIQKKRGEVIPSELIPPVILQHNQSIITSFKNEFEEWLRNIAKKYSLTINDIADARSQGVDWINSAMSKATDMSVSAVSAIVKDYSEKRGVGERVG